MDDRSFDRLTRQVAADGARRGPLAMFGAPGLETVARQLTAESKQRRGKKNKKKQKAQQCPPAPDLCGPQVAPCTALLTAQCGAVASCQDVPACCSLLATCDSAGFFACLVTATSSP